MNGLVPPFLEMALAARLLSGPWHGKGGFKVTVGFGGGAGRKSAFKAMHQQRRC